jgi:single-stranded DNA-binding protein
MESYMLTTIITGHVGSVKFVTAAGKSPVLNVNIATSRKMGDREFTDWTSAKIWGERAERLQHHVFKGQRLLITGRPEARGYTAVDGTAKAELVVHVNELEFLSAKLETDAEAAPEHEGAEPALEGAA